MENTELLAKNQNVILIYNNLELYIAILNQKILIFSINNTYTNCLLKNLILT